jgi:hypothetical protein
MASLFFIVDKRQPLCKRLWLLSHRRGRVIIARMIKSLPFTAVLWDMDGVLVDILTALPRLVALFAELQHPLRWRTSGALLA